MVGCGGWDGVQAPHRSWYHRYHFFPVHPAPHLSSTSIRHLGVVIRCWFKGIQRGPSTMSCNIFEPFSNPQDLVCLTIQYRPILQPDTWATAFEWVSVPDRQLGADLTDTHKKPCHPVLSVIAAKTVYHYPWKLLRFANTWLFWWSSTTWVSLNYVQLFVSMWLFFLSQGQMVILL